jgi:hypothetical protein
MYCELERTRDGTEHFGVLAITSALQSGKPQFKS